MMSAVSKDRKQPMDKLNKFRQFIAQFPHYTESAFEIAIS